MTQQTTAQSRVIDPILTTHAQGYLRPGNVGRFLFPIATVRSYGGQILEFGKESFRRYNTKRAPGSATKRITFGYAGKPYAITPAGLEALVPDENQNDAAQVPGLDLASDAVDVVLDTHELAHEYECAELARDASKYDNDHKVTLAGSNIWTADGSDPTQDIGKAKNAVRGSIGVRPNTVLLSASSFAALESNKSIIDRLKYTGRDSVTAELLAKLWNVQNVYVGEAVGASGQDDDLSDVWGNDVIVAYVAPPTGGNSRSNARPSYGYTYSITGMPLVRKPYRDENARSWVYPVDADRVPVMSGMLAGYLIQGAGAGA
ncbi:TPA: major capsid protein [Stenotrophomonas maltophilia]|uniref:major capsid protein n=1 Tax=Stenotrophomonas maltophilia TaxID=40324 RepID=UPI00106A518B|nr:major capsid protein [Stenotrophomonas maltophilia]